MREQRASTETLSTLLRVRGYHGGTSHAGHTNPETPKRFQEEDGASLSANVDNSVAFLEILPCLPHAHERRALATPHYEAPGGHTDRLVASISQLSRFGALQTFRQSAPRVSEWRIFFREFVLRERRYLTPNLKDAVSTTSPRTERRTLGSNPKAEQHDGEISSQASCAQEADDAAFDAVVKEVKNAHSLRKKYKKLFHFLLFASMYGFVLYSQLDNEGVEVVPSIQLAYPSIWETGTGARYEKTASVQSVINSLVLQIWKMPVCGNQLCEMPYETKAFGRFGCAADCGYEYDLYPVVVKIQADFRKSPITTLSPHDLMTSATWNLCTQNKVFNSIETCWYERDQRFDELRVNLIEKYELPSMLWSVTIRNDFYHLVGGKVYDAANWTDLQHVETAPPWVACSASDWASDSSQPGAMLRHLQDTSAGHDVARPTHATGLPAPVNVLGDTVAISLSGQEGALRLSPRHGSEGTPGSGGMAVEPRNSSAQLLLTDPPPSHHYRGRRSLLRKVERKALQRPTALFIDLQAAEYTAGASTWNDLSLGLASQGPSDGIMGIDESPTGGSYLGVPYLSFSGAQFVPLKLPALTSSAPLLQLTVGVYFRTSYSASYYSECNSQDKENWSLLDFDRGQWFSLSIGGAGQLMFSTKSGSVHDMCTLSPQNTYHDNTWRYVTAVFDSAASPNKMLYMDGVLVASATASGHADGLGAGRKTRYGVIGDGSKATDPYGSNRNKGYFFEGDISLAHAYSAALSASDVLANYVAISDKVVLQPASSLFMDLQASQYAQGESTWKDLSSGLAAQGRSNGMMNLTASPTASSAAGVSCLSFNNAHYVPLELPQLSPSAPLLQLTVGAYFRTSYSASYKSACSSYDKGNWALLDFDRSDWFTLALGGAGQLWFSTSSETNIHDLCTLSPQNTYNDNTWRYVTAVFDSAASPNKMLYMDGVLVASATASGHGTGIGSNNDVRYGMIGDGTEATTANGGRNQKYFDGDISMVHMYNSALSASDVLANYVAISGRVTLQSASSLFMDLQASQYAQGESTWKDLSSGLAAQGRSNGMMNLTASPTAWSAAGVSYLSFNNAHYVPLELPQLSPSAPLLQLTVGVYFRTSYSNNYKSACTSYDNTNWALLDFDRSNWFTLALGGAGQLWFSTSGETVHDLCTLSPQNTYNDNTWRYVTAVFDSAASPNKMLYMDGVLVASATASGHGTGIGSHKGARRTDKLTNARRRLSQQPPADTLTDSRTNCLTNRRTDRPHTAGSNERDF
ncbi:hypothetical protein CYMTET_10844 [Cymbomonas tetramitiformis]|uniref:LamG-like jellyroll fold domain-containing protein n=1 Tax=Cymbomonas tetramitiformis TaxID=36881 RepID=A0AAE0LDR7_9CHLO|nr:hypothetical protein CYMTET_10844 [Cymbomonas tetramitiformis]